MNDDERRDLRAQVTAQMDQVCAGVQDAMAREEVLDALIAFSTSAERLMTVLAASGVREDALASALIAPIIEIAVARRQ